MVELKKTLDERKKMLAILQLTKEINSNDQDQRKQQTRRETLDWDIKP
jgi:hypothetical protein